MVRFHCLPTDTPSEMSAAIEAKTGCSCPKITLARYHARPTATAVWRIGQPLSQMRSMPPCRKSRRAEAWLVIPPTRFHP
jgi:hypothetical protein